MKGTSAESVARDHSQAPSATSPLAGPSGEGKVTGRKGWAGVRIGWKITAVVVVVMIFLAVANILFIRRNFNDVMNREFESKAKAIALAIGRSSQDMLVASDVVSLQALVEVYKDVRGIQYIIVQEASGNLVAGTFKMGISQALLDLKPVQGEQEFQVSRFVLEGVGDIIEVAVPVIFGVAGTVRVGMDHGLITGELAQITRSLILQFAVASIFGILILHLTVLFLLRHLKTVLAVLKKAGEGDLTSRVEVATRDEFLDLAQRINGTLFQIGRMINRVDQSYDEISLARDRIAQVYHDVQEGIDQQGGLASETMDSVVSNKKMIDEVTEGIHVLENSSNDSFSSIMELGASIEEVSAMSDSLFNSVKESNQAIEDLSASIEQISGNLATLSGSAQETASAMNEMSASIVEVRGNAESTAQDAVQMTRVAEEGATVSRNAMEGMGAIKDSSAQVSQMIALLSDRIEEIDEILRFITDITGKTNLLALNAAIIAAQAGAHGKGFGVVADEINELAQNTKAQTNRIADVIDGLREEVLRTSEAVEESNKKVDEGVSLAEKVTMALEGIMDSTMLVSHRIEEIAQTTSEQASTSNRVLATTQNLTDSVANIKQSGAQQKEASEKLLQMSRLIQQVAQKVKTSTEEQTLTSQQINKDLTKISETVRSISESTEIQVVNGAKVLKMTEDLSRVIQGNRDSVHGLEGVMEDLNRRLSALKQELGVFLTEKAR